MIPKGKLRLYRGLTKKYRPEKVGKNNGPLAGTDFTDCPYRALSFARGTRGVVLVADIPEEGESRVREALWSLDGKGPKRFIIYGRLDKFLVAEIPAKELRAKVRKKGVVKYRDDSKSSILVDHIEKWISQMRLRQEAGGGDSRAEAGGGYP